MMLNHVVLELPGFVSILDLILYSFYLLFLLFIPNNLEYECLMYFPTVLHYSSLSRGAVEHMYAFMVDILRRTCDCRAYLILRLLFIDEISHSRGFEHQRSALRMMFTLALPALASFA